MRKYGRESDMFSDGLFLIRTNLSIDLSTSCVHAIDDILPARDMFVVPKPRSMRPFSTAEV
jgi:hypothetical protein